MQKLSLKIDSNLLPENNEKEIVADTSSDSIKNNDLENLSNDENTLGTLKISSNDLSEPSTDSIEQDEPNNELSPEEQFQLAYDYLRSQKLDKAKSLLELFIKNHPSHVLAGLAQYWLGEVIYLNKEYRQAAIVFSEGYQKYPESVKAPESLYKLAESLIKIEKKDDACATLNQFLIKYPNHELIKKINLKINDLQCS
jgi:tol-pal system protein YbgF